MKENTYYSKNKEKILVKQREYNDKNRELVNEKERARYIKDPLRKRCMKYKIPKDQYLQMVESQNNECAICKKDMVMTNIDHCHKTKEVRGLLCTDCNLGIGRLKDDTDILESAINYLKGNKDAKI